MRGRHGLDRSTEAGSKNLAQGGWARFAQMRWAGLARRPHFPDTRRLQGVEVSWNVQIQLARNETGFGMRRAISTQNRGRWAMCNVKIPRRRFIRRNRRQSFLNN